MLVKEPETQRIFKKISLSLHKIISGYTRSQEIDKNQKDMNRKKINLRSALMLMALMLLVGCSKDNRVIEKPVFLASNKNAIEVSKVTLTDSTTVLDIFARYRPKYWIKIDPNSFLTDDKGQTYPLSQGVGIEPGKKFWMPESGEAEFQLVFPRLRSGAKYFHFSEGPSMETGFKIWGVQLKGDRLPRLELPKHVKAQPVDKEAPLEVPGLTFGEATLKGKVLDYQPGMPDELQMIVYHPLCGYENLAVKIGGDGTFTHTMPVLGTTKAFAFNNDLHVSSDLFLAPGQTSEVYLNIREASRQRSKYHADSEPYGKISYYSGPLENLMREFQESENLLKDYKKDTYDFTQNPEVLLETYKKNRVTIMAKYKEALARASMSQAMKTYMEREFDFQLLVGLSQAPNVLTNEYVMAHPEADRTMYGDFYTRLSRVHSSDYVDKELYAILNDPQSLLNAQYGVVVRESALTGRMPHIAEGQFTQMVAASKLYHSITDFIPLTDGQKASMEALPEACRQYLNAANDKLLAKIEANKKSGVRVNEVGEVADEDLFASIISQFRGKVLLVDFWGTWCGPCRTANKEMLPMKKELKDKDIVYVYITGETSRKGTWENMIPDIHGEHFRVTDKQWTYLCNNLGVEGVPTYFVIDREGGIKYKSTGFPGVAKMKEELLKVVE